MQLIKLKTNRTRAWRAPSVGRTTERDPAGPVAFRPCGAALSCVLRWIIHEGNFAFLETPSTLIRTKTTVLRIRLLPVVGNRQRLCLLIVLQQDNVSVIYTTRAFLIRLATRTFSRFTATLVD